MASSFLRGGGLTARQSPLASPLRIAAPAPRAALRLRLYAALLLLDAALVVLAFALASGAWLGDLAQGRDLTAIFLPLYLVFALDGRAYSLDVLRAPRLGMRRAARALVLAVGSLIGILFYLKVSATFSRAVMGGGTLTAAGLLLAGRCAWGGWIGRRHHWRFTSEVLLVGGSPAFGLRGETTIVAGEAGLDPSQRDPAALDKAGRMLAGCDRIVVACPAERRSAWAGMLKGLGVDVEFVAPELERIGALRMSRFDGRATLLVSRGPLALRDRTVKRAFDLALAIPALLVLAPLFLAIALAIRVDTPGPVFFRQTRMGLGNRLFPMLKFRTMYADSGDASASRLTERGDGRVTRVGRLLRRTSLDELPQLLNVARGDMSLAGPRPHALGARAGGTSYWEVDSRYWHRHAVKPGITGLAQVRGFRGTTFEPSDLTARLQADLEYLSGWSIWRDVRILGATLRVLAHPNAF